MHGKGQAHAATRLQSVFRGAQRRRRIKESEVIGPVCLRHIQLYCNFTKTENTMSRNNLFVCNRIGVNARGNL